MSNVLADLFVKIDADNSGLNSGLTAAKGMLSGFGGAAMGIAAAAGAALVAGFAIKEIISAYSEGEVAANQLAAAFEGAGVAVDSNMAAFGQVASEIMNLTTVGDEAVAEMYRFGISLGIPAEGLENASKAAIGLGRAFNLDNATVMKALAKETQGVHSSLEKYLPQLKGVTDTEQRLAIIRDAANKGLIQEGAYTETLAGSWAMLQNALGEVAEGLGGFLAPALVATSQVLKDVAVWFQSLITEIQSATYETENMSATWNMISNIWGETGGIASAMSEFIVSAIQGIVSVIDYMYGIVNEGIFIFLNLDLAAQSTWVAIKEGTVNAANSFMTFFENVGIGLSWYKDNFSTIWMNAFNMTLTILSNFGSNVMSFMQELWDWMTTLGADPIEIKLKPLTEGAYQQELEGPKYKTAENTTMFDGEKADLANEWDKRRQEFEALQKAKPVEAKPKLTVGSLAKSADIESDKEAAELRQKGLEKERDMKSKWAKEDKIEAEKERLDKVKEAAMSKFDGAGSFQGLGDGFKNATKSLADKDKNREAERQTKLQEESLKKFTRMVELQENAASHQLGLA